MATVIVKLKSQFGCAVGMPPRAARGGWKARHLRTARTPVPITQFRAQPYQEHRTKTSMHPAHNDPIINKEDISLLLTKLGSPYKVQVTAQTPPLPEELSTNIQESASWASTPPIDVTRPSATTILELYENTVHNRKNGLAHALWIVQSGEHSREELSLKRDLREVHLHSTGLPFNYTRDLMRDLRCKRKALTFPMFSAKGGADHLRETFLTQQEFSSLCELLGTPDQIFVDCQMRPASIPPDVQHVVAAYPGLTPVAEYPTNSVFQVKPTTITTLQTLFTHLTTTTIYQRDNIAVLSHAIWTKKQDGLPTKANDDLLCPSERITMTPSKITIESEGTHEYALKIIAQYTFGVDIRIDPYQTGWLD